MILLSLLLSLAPVFVQDPAPSQAQDAGAPLDSPGGVQAPLSFDLGEGTTQPVPRDEKLTFSVNVDLGLINPTAGTVTLNARVEPWQDSILFGGSDADAGESAAEIGVYTIHAKGKHSIYSLDTTIETRLLPQAWPRLSYRFTQEGSEQRRREIQIGARRGQDKASYRGDTKKNAPKGQRVWNERKYREVPPGTVDMLSAVYLARRLIESGETEMEFPLLDKLRLWKMRLRRGKEVRVSVDAGTFDCLRLELIPEPWEGETEGLTKEQAAKFEGLLGLKGTIVLLVEKSTGVPVRIQGDLPAGPFTLGIDVSLKSYSGTPAGFLPTGG